MAITAAETTSLITLRMPAEQFSAQLARFCVRGALSHHNLGGYGADAEIIASELATNAIQHAGPEAFGLELVHLGDSAMIAVIVTDSSADPLVRRDPAGDAQHGRGLNIVAALSARWGWRPEGSGKAVYAILAREAE
jgi:anti-sigma regulatory factor (Ser/Thr protein kinase)